MTLQNLNKTISNESSYVTVSAQSTSGEMSAIINISLALISATGAVGTVGVFTNGLALIVIFGYTTIWKKISFYVFINQIAIDFVTCLFIALQYFSITEGDPPVTLYNVKVTNDALCRWWYSKAIMWSLIFSANYSVVLITLERYVKILYPLVYQAQVTKVNLKSFKFRYSTQT